MTTPVTSTPATSTVSFNVENMRAASKVLDAEKDPAGWVSTKLDHLTKMCEESRFPPAYAPFIRLEANRAKLVIADALQNAEHEARMLRWRAAFVLLTNGRPDREALKDMREASLFLVAPRTDAGDWATLLDLAGLLFFTGADNVVKYIGGWIDVLPEEMVRTLKKFSDVLGVLSGLATAAAVYRRGTATTESGRVAASLLAGGVSFGSGKVKLVDKAVAAAKVTSLHGLSVQIDGLVNAKSEGDVSRLESLILGTSRSGDRYSARAKSGEYGVIPRNKEESWWW